eukprot:365566-Chlamydomonas_euryale.AAC.9
MEAYCTFILPVSLSGCETWSWTEVQMGRRQVNIYVILSPPHCRRLADRHYLETIREQCGMFSLEFIV